MQIFFKKLLTLYILCGIMLSRKEKRPRQVQRDEHQGFFSDLKTGASERSGDSVDTSVEAGTGTGCANNGLERI